MSGQGAMARVLLVDGDYVAHRAAAAVERAVNWSGPDEAAALWTLHGDAEEAFGAFQEMIARLADRLTPDRVLLAFSDAANWRKALCPTYKAQRATRRKPVALPALIARLESVYETRRRAGLEADDVLGLSLTEPDAGEERICVSADKDLRGTPGLHAGLDGEVTAIDRAAADRWHLLQALAGDPADGYPGCPGVGVETAQAFLDAPYELVAERRTVSRGVRAGQGETRWRKRPTDELWRGIVSLYARAGLAEADALLQARLARILRHGEIDAAGRPILWRPAWLRRR